MDHRRHPIGLFIGEPGDSHPLFRSEKALMNHHVSTFGFFGKPLVRDAVAAKHKAQAVPVQAEAH